MKQKLTPLRTKRKLELQSTTYWATPQSLLSQSREAALLFAEAKGQDSLTKLRNIMRNDRVRDASRRLLLKSTRGNTIKFFLNKQVAFAGHVSFSEETSESPLGPIRFTIETDNPQQLVEWLAEKTERK